MFSFTLANNLSFHDLKFEVVYLVASVIALIRVSKAVISINALLLEFSIVWNAS